MPLLTDVLTWSQRQKPWVQDALRRVVSDTAIEPADYNVLFKLLLADQGFVFDPPLVADVLTDMHLPAIPAAGVTNVLGISQMQHVNRFPDDSEISFSAAGLTIVYGENGSGKSGIARVLKQVCRARKRDAVLANAYAADYASKVPTALMKYIQDGHEQTLSWSMAHAAPREMQSIAVFDGACAMDYVTEERDSTFQPFGIAYLERLTDTVLPELLRRIDRALGTLDCDTQRFATLSGSTTEIGKVLSAISRTTDIEEVKRLGVMTDEHTDRLTLLNTSLNEANAKVVAEGHEALAERLAALATTVQNARNSVGDDSVQKLRTLVEASVNTKKDVDAATKLLESDLLEGTGGGLWRTMFLAAKEYSVHGAYPEHEAPHVGDGAKCVLCQTDLDEDAKARLTAFNSFVISNAATAHKAASEKVTTAYDRLAGLNLSLTIDPTFQSELDRNAPSVLSILNDVREELDARRQWMVEQRNANTWLDTPQQIFEPSCVGAIEAMARANTVSAAHYRDLLNDAGREAMTLERDELVARQTASPHIPTIETVVQHLRRKDLLDRCKKALDTTFISKQIGVLTTKYVTQALVNDMNAELTSLGVIRVGHTIRKRIDRGKTMMSLVLNGSQAKVHTVLSEGEQRVAAFAMFLAELKQSGSLSGLIVDDPVSSLDHRYRHRVAKRLAHESTHRQVIVLTHDAVFLSGLLDECEKKGLAPSVKTIMWMDNAPGHVQTDLPWLNQSVGDRISALHADRKRIAALWGDNPSEDAKRDMAEIYARVRGTLERIIRESIFNKAVKPFADRIAVERVGAVAGFSREEFDQLYGVYLHCNPSLDGHDSSGEGSLDGPNPLELAADVAILEQLVANAKARDKALKAEISKVESATKRDS